MTAKLRRRPSLQTTILGAGLAVATLAACSTAGSIRDSADAAAAKLGDTAHSAAVKVGNSIRSTSDSVREKADPIANDIGAKIADTLPKAAGGLPAGLPPRPDVSPAFVAVHDMPPERELKRMTIQQRKKLEADLVAVRDRQEKLNPNSHSPASVAQATPDKKAPATKPPHDQPSAKQAAGPAQSADAQANR
jgi:hypothetical protein